MTLTSLITLNAILMAVVVYGVVFLLAHGIRSDRSAVEAVKVRQLPRRESDRIAA